MRRGRRKFFTRCHEGIRSKKGPMRKKRRDIKMIGDLQYCTVCEKLGEFTARRRITNAS